MKTIGVDIDNVIINYTKALGTLYARIKNDNPEKYQETSSWDFEDWNLPYDKFKEIHKDLLENHEHLFELIPYAVEGLTTLINRGNLVHLITHRASGPAQPLAEKASIIKSTLNTLERLKVPFHYITFTHEKSKIACDLYIDDSPSVLKEYKEAKLDYLIYPYKYNSELPGERFQWKDLYSSEEYLRY